MKNNRGSLFFSVAFVSFGVDQLFRSARGEQKEETDLPMGNHGKKSTRIKYESPVSLKGQAVDVQTVIGSTAG